jgi:glycerol uptake facilitator-like aquaporin
MRAIKEAMLQALDQVHTVVNMTLASAGDFLPSSQQFLDEDVGTATLCRVPLIVTNQANSIPTTAVECWLMVRYQKAIVVIYSKFRCRSP